MPDSITLPSFRKKIISASFVAESLCVIKIIVFPKKVSVTRLLNTYSTKASKAVKQGKRQSHTKWAGVSTVRICSGSTGNTSLSDRPKGIIKTLFSW